MDKYEGEFPSKYFNDFLNYLGISEEHFHNVVDEWRPEHMFGKNRAIFWVFKHPIK